MAQVIGKNIPASLPPRSQLAYDLKYGFNKRKQLSMAVWLNIPSWMRYNEVAVLVENEEMNAPYSLS